MLVITGPNQFVSIAWANDIQNLCRWCKEGEVGLMPVMASPDLEVAFASAHSRSISVALREELVKKKDRQRGLWEVIRDRFQWHHICFLDRSRIRHHLKDLR